VRRIGNLWITAMVHYLDAEGCLADLSAPARNLANHLGAIVSTLTGQPPGELRQTSVRCRRRPGRRLCAGQIWAVIEVGSGRISWECPTCGDNGVIHDWEGTPWDQTPKGQGSARPEDRAMAAGVAGRIVQVTYARAMLDRVADAAAVPSTTLTGEILPPVVIDAIQRERLEELAGEWGELDAGEPIEYEQLHVAYERGGFELTLFNRCILLIFSDDERIRRMHRALCVVHDAVERLGGSESG
jgi:hypothetical protein